MSIHYRILMLLCCLWSTNIYAQRYTLEGTITDAATNEPIIGATISIKNSSSRTGAISDIDGKYQVQLKSGTYFLNCSLINYTPYKDSITITGDQKLDIVLSEKVIQISGVTITAERPDKNVQSTEMGKTTVKVEQAQKLPSLMGEVDIMKTLQLLPGVQSSGEGTNGLLVRGGNIDQNLILLDEAPIYNTGHLFGFFSVFNSDAIENMTLYKSGTPAQYGGRLSSVLTVDSKNGNVDKFHANGGIGLISSRLTIETPIQKGKSSLLLSGRRTYIDVVTQPIVEAAETNGIPYYFYDLNGRLKFKLSDKDQLFITGYTGKDDVSLSVMDGRFETSFYWTNSALSTHWKHTFSDSLFLDVYLIRNGYNFFAEANFDNFESTAFSGIEGYQAKARLKAIYPKHELHYGATYGYLIYTPRDLNTSTDDADGVNFDADILNVSKYNNDISLYVHDYYEINKKWKVDGGLRLNLFQHLGDYTEIIEHDNFQQDTIQYGRFESVRNFWSVEPRAAARYAINDSSSIKASITYNSQNAHLLSLSGNALPFDIWVPSSALLSPQTSIQYSAGYFRNFKNNLFETSIEVYYKDFWGQVEFGESYRPSFTGELENDLTIGTGNAYGVEFFAKKQKGKLQGWFGYTFAYSNRVFDEINEGEQFPSRNDRRHDLSVALTYDISKKWSLGSNFVYGSGQAITIQEAFYLVEGNIVTKYGPRNGFRMPPYHRLDLSATYTRKPNSKKFHSSWVFSVYNVYNRANPYLIYFLPEGNLAEGEVAVRARQLSIFPILPSITWNFKF
ncbi:MAG: TonB-dependent receptor [Cytophagales bacterium]|nr:TonB-dependent receptor [Cytophagales bacterium]